MLLHRSRISYLIHGFAKSGILISTSVAACEAGLTKLPDRPDFWEPYQLIQWQAANWGWLVIIAASVFGALCAYIQKKVGSPDILEILHSLLDDLRSDVFPESDYGDTPDFHRVTLFQCRCFRNKWHFIGICRAIFDCEADILVPIVRSGHTSQETVSYFKIGDSVDTCEGVAGRAWFKNGLVSVHNLADLTVSPSEQSIQDYANQTFLSIERIKSKMPRARAILAVPVPKEGGPWGVLVFDSRNPANIGHERVEKLCGMLAKHLSKVTQKIL